MVGFKKLKKEKTVTTSQFAINNTVELVLEIIRKVLPITDKKCDSISGKCKSLLGDFMWFQVFKMFGNTRKVNTRMGSRRTQRIHPRIHKRLHEGRRMY
jgi:hypothetical protein